MAIVLQLICVYVSPLSSFKRETDETSLPLFSLNGKQSHVASHVDDFYEMEVGVV